MVFVVTRLVTFVSATVAPEPEDAISAGTSRGVGVLRDLRVLLEPGDRGEVGDFGALSNPVGSYV